MWQMRSLAALLLAALGAAVLASCANDTQPSLEPGQLRIATGLTGGVYRVYGRALATALDEDLRPMRATALQTAGSVENLNALDSNRADVAFTLADTASAAIRGTRPSFTRSLKLQALARLYDDYVQIIVRADSDLREMRDLAGRSISIGARGSGTALVARRILGLPAVGLDGGRAVRMRSLELEQATATLAARRIDAFVWSGGLPTDAIVALRKKIAIRLLGLPADTAERLDPDLYTQATVQATVYGRAGAVSTIIASNLLVVRPDMPDEVAYRITRALFEHKRELVAAHEQARRLNLRDAPATFPLGLHPGAKRWYREANR